MNTVSLCFEGYKSDEVAHKFYTWVVDGGLEDEIVDTLSDNDISVEGILNFDNKKLNITIESKQVK